MKCSKPDCPCCDSEEARHGPYYSVSRVVNGKTQSRWLNAKEAEVVRRQLEQGQAFRKNIEAYWEACERWADAELETLEAASAEAVKKGASKRCLKPKSLRKSRSSSLPSRSNATPKRLACEIADADEHFPDATQIVDLYHAKGHL